MQVEPLRDCCVNAYELFGSEEWRNFSQFEWYRG